MQKILQYILPSNLSFMCGTYGTFFSLSFNPLPSLDIFSPTNLLVNDRTFDYEKKC